MWQNGNLQIERFARSRDALARGSSLKPVTTNKPLVRFGPNGDGGYLIPDDYRGIEYCFSPGVGGTSGFELKCSQEGMEVFLADASVECPQFSNNKFHFIKKYVGTQISSNYILIDDWVKNSITNVEKDLIFQMDIEGAEYNNIMPMSDNLMGKIRIFVIEFHDLNKLWSEDFFSLANKTFDKILKTHTCVHIHPNNSNRPFIRDGIIIPPVCEFTFLRKDRIISSSPYKTFPNKLDYNNTSASDFVLPDIWHY